MRSVNKTIGNIYTFTSSVATDVITITNADGSGILTVGKGSVSLLAASNQPVRFYTTHSVAVRKPSFAPKA